MRIAILTSGGDAPGMNAAVRTVVKLAADRGHEAFAVRDGYSGLMAGDIEPLALHDVDGISRIGGTILGSARAPEFCEAAGRTGAVAALAEHRIDGLVVVGGNGSLTGAHALAAETPCTIVGVPASIDNDIGHTRTAIGVDTAVNTIVEACDRITDTATAHRRAFVVEVMGRDCGFLAMRAGLAAEADAILYAESGQTDDEIVEHLRQIIRTKFSARRSGRRVLIIKSEGVRMATVELCERLRAHLDEDAPGVSLRETVLGHVVRGGRPSQTDRVVAQRLTFGAVLAIEERDTDVMVGWETYQPPQAHIIGGPLVGEVPASVGKPTVDPRVRRVPLADVLAETRCLLDGTSPVTRARVALLRQAGF